MFRFANIEFLWGLVLIPLFILVFILFLRWKKKAVRTFGDYPVVTRLIPEVSRGKTTAKFILFCFAFLFLIVGLANPQIGSKMEEVKREGIDLIIALDVSNSMKAEDLAPNRLERAKRAISQLVDRLRNDRLGLIVFAGQAYVQLPLTIDYAAAKMFLETIDTDIIPTQGTSIGAAIELSMNSFDPESKAGKAIIIITDGEDHEQMALKNAEKAVKEGIAIHTIGMGSVKGAPIPIYRGNKPIGFREDKDGNTVVTKLNEDMLRELAMTGDGIYVRASNARMGLDYIMEEISKMQTASFGTKVYTDYENRFQYFIALTLILLLIEFLLSYRRSKWLNSLNIFGGSSAKTIGILVLLSFSSLFVQAQEGNNLILEGNKKYHEGDYQGAEEKYQEALGRDSKSFEGLFNAADALYKQEKYEEAADRFRTLSERTSDKESKAKVMHNLGNSLLKADQLEQSIAAYKEALRNNPADEDTRHNLAYAQQLLQQEQEKEQDKDDKKEDEKNDEDQKKDENKDDQDKDENQEQNENENENKDQEKDKQDNQQNQENQDQNNEQEKKPQPNQLSKEEAERLLDALKNQELDVQEKLDRKAKGEKVEKEKDW